MDVLKKAHDNPLFSQLAEYLALSRAMPELVFTPFYQDGSYSQRGFFSGQDLPPQGRLSMHKNGSPGTLAHELTHAADARMEDQASYYRVHGINSPAASQFSEARKKLVFNPRGDSEATRYPRVAMAKKLDPAWNDKNADYRSTHGELAAFGVGNVTPGHRIRHDVPLHLDPTMATELAILLELATRAKREDYAHSRVPMGR